MNGHQDQVAALLAKSGKLPGGRPQKPAAPGGSAPKPAPTNPAVDHPPKNTTPPPPPPPPVKTEHARPPRPPKKPRRASTDDPTAGKARSVRLDRDVSTVVWPAVWATHSTLTQLLLDAARAWHRDAADLPDAPAAAGPAPDPDDPFPARQTREPLRRVNHHPYLTGAELSVLDQLADKAGVDRATFCSRVLRRHLVGRVFVPANTALPEEAVLAQRIQAVSAGPPAAVPQERQPWIEFPTELLTDPVRAALSAASGRLYSATWTEVMITALT